jgi:hypothetical protein
VPNVTLASFGPLAGHACVNIDFDRLTEFKADAYAAGVGYSFGGKDPRAGSGVIDFDAIDCSGWVRTTLIYVTHGMLADIPDGSFCENDYFARKGFKEKVILSAADCGSLGLSDGLLRVAVHLPNGRGGDATGHISLFVNGHSIESYGGHGPGERPANHPWFLNHWDRSYVLGPMVKPWKEA